MSSFSGNRFWRPSFRIAKRNLTIGMIGTCLAGGFLFAATTSRPGQTPNSASSPSAKNSAPWWKHALVYEIYRKRPGLAV